MFYGSFGAGIATLVWLYITTFSVLIGAEMNGALYRRRGVQFASAAQAETQSSRQ
jgi:membrane protein